jgi:DNA-binding winged helix-turn-helix (wHTH) protein
MKYLFNDVVFTPNERKNLIVDGEVKPLPKKQVALLKYFLDTNQKISDNKKIVAAVWGEGEHTYDALRTAISRINQALPDTVQIENLKKEGYKIDVNVTKIATKYNKTELILEQSPFVKKASIVALVSLFLLSIAGIGSWAGVGNWVAEPPPVYSVQNISEVFTRDHLVGLPQLSPDGQYVAHRLASKKFEDDYLALTDLTSGQTKRLAKMHFDDEFKWDWTGNKIVYQKTTKNHCEIRLLRFDAGKEVADDSLLTQCLTKSGTLSFAWFNDNEFYVNLVDSERSGFPLHQLYTFDSRSKQATKILTAKDEGGVGFYSLEYDKTIDTLYLLRIDEFLKTTIYRYRDGALSTLTKVDHLVLLYTVANNQLIYKNDNNELVINQVAGDFNSQQVLLPSPMVPVAAPHFNGNRLTFMAGSTIGLTLNKLKDKQLSRVELAGFNPSVLANYNETLVFASDQTGIHQIYQRLHDNTVIQLSDMQQNERVKYITVAGDIFAVSYYDKVRIYQNRQGKLTLLHDLPGYTNAFLSANGETALLSTTAGRKATGTIVEMQLGNIQPQPLNINDTLMAAYYQGDVIYVDKNHQLYRYSDNKHQLLASNINVRAFEQALLQQEKLYYIATKAGASTLFVYDLATGVQTTVALDGAAPTRMVTINNEVYVRVREVLRPKLMVGDVVPK